MTRTSTRMRGPRGSHTVKLKRSPSATPGGMPDEFIDSVWAGRGRGSWPEMLDLYRRLIALRRSRPDLSDPRLDQVQVWHGDQHLVMRRGRCAVAVNLAPTPLTVSLRAAPRTVLLATEPGVALLRDRVEMPAESAVVVEYR